MGWICSCDIINTECKHLCLGCGKRRTETFLKLKLYKYKGINATAFQHADMLRITVASFRNKIRLLKGHRPKRKPNRVKLTVKKCLVCEKKFLADARRSYCSSICSSNFGYIG